jgi:hypothetical protein
MLVTGESPQPFSKTNTAQPNQCMLLTHLILAPKPSVDAKVHERGMKIEEALALK